jgi:Do/DeqQ family serine protease
MRWAVWAGLTAALCGGCSRHEPEGRGSAPAPIVVSTSEPVRSTGSVTSYAPVVDKVAPSVVSVYSTKSVRGRVLTPLIQSPLLRRFFGEGDSGGDDVQPREEESLGSGIILSKDGYILTNNHVIAGADEVRVSMVNGAEYPAKIIGADPGTDVAVLKIQATDLPAATLADSSQIRVGDLAFAIGNPFGVGQTVTMGIVSATERTGFGLTEYEDFIQTDAAVNPGNSGGPLVDASGRVMGMNTAILSRSGGYQGIGFAVPINLARSTMEELIKNGKVVRGYLGILIQPLTPNLAQAMHAPEVVGTVIAGVAKRGPAARAGLKPGDVIVGVNGKKVASSPELRLAIAQLAPGSSARIEIYRDGKQLEMPVKVGELPKQPSIQQNG